MKKVYLIRYRADEAATLGTLTVPNAQLYTCKTLELPWINNEQSISCIPVGEYKCVYSRSPLLSIKSGKDVFTYEVLDVPNRDGIRIHKANFFYELRGCIALGNALKDINGDGNMDVINSDDTLERFEELMNLEPFTLKIIDIAA